MKKIAFTIVLNGEPFIQKQAEILPDVFDEWHIIEGATLNLKDTSWCRPIDSKFYTDRKLSIDGTTEFLDSIVNNKNIFVHRKYDFFNGKTEMCNCISDRMENCILMQFDVDEIWNKTVLNDVLNYATTMKEIGILFHCNYYLGPDLKIINENCYGNNPGEWARLWKISNKTHWVSHEPPVIAGSDRNNVVPRIQSKKNGWIFEHYAYTTKEQLLFKENFYGYTNAYNNWLKLQELPKEKFPQYVRNYLPWVKDNAIVDKI